MVLQLELGDIPGRLKRSLEKDSCKVFLKKRNGLNITKMNSMGRMGMHHG